MSYSSGYITEDQLIAPIFKENRDRKNIYFVMSKNKKIVITTCDYACIGTAGLLLLCLAPMPYGYYTIVRILVMCLSLYIGFRFVEQKNTALAIVAGSVALVFQPFVKIALNKSVWNVIDVIVAVALVVYVIVTHKKQM